MSGLPGLGLPPGFADLIAQIPIPRGEPPIEPLSEDDVRRIVREELAGQAGAEPIPDSHAAITTVRAGIEQLLDSTTDDADRHPDLVEDLAVRVDDSHKLGVFHIDRISLEIADVLKLRVNGVDHLLHLSVDGISCSVHSSPSQVVGTPSVGAEGAPGPETQPGAGPGETPTSLSAPIREAFAAAVGFYDCPCGSEFEFTEDTGISIERYAALNHWLGHHGRCGADR